MEKRHRAEVEKMKEMCKQDIMMKVEKRLTKVILSELWTHIAEYKEKMDEKDREIEALKQKNLPGPLKKRWSMSEPIQMKTSTENQFSFGRWILLSLPGHLFYLPSSKTSAVPDCAQRVYPLEL
ncbi:hypothetical protein Q8A67_003250 [Cirrhinus molitorella]|uniref:Uncharacterized protein n=1 Tax=Cirrhinus molitorella TaxID=172907 RepID=A0AA88TXN7_9TELE|nr:hypothetical protein Q8A67_003250 [Cirrhinus molitorella]